ncbi:MAG: DUF4445 domain-containing protein [Clostridiales bacterium]|nr:DUF4445 domain-containing protein [Clostridiales bacterium]
MNRNILFLPDRVSIDVPEGTLLSDAAKRAGVFLDLPCGGNGTCGKCAVLLARNGETQSVSACQTKVETDCTVTLPERAGLSALSEGAERAVAFAPCPGADTAFEGACFAAIDLGTTTIVCYLLDAETGVQIAAVGMQNPQSVYGADVIARANHALTGEHPGALKDCAVSAINELIASTTASAARRPEQVALVSIVGNTVMHHLLLSYPVGQLVRAPYEPHMKQRRILSARSLGIVAHPQASVLVAPVVGGFVGADTVACMTATAFDGIAEPTLLLDIGTNGELVLTDGKRRVCCSTAAGPAFEGATISCGMRAESGAVDHVWLDHGELMVSTIQNAPAKGLCGSGLVELCALLVRRGVISESGRFDESASLGGRIITLEDGVRAFVVADGERRVTLSQKDVRELQLGKAAIRAGIETLLGVLSLRAEDIARVLLAGAFGSHLSAEALCDIGLLPEAVRARVESVGNAAGEGAKLYARNFSLFEESELLARQTEYIELTVSPVFAEYYVDAMAFPEPTGQRG